MNERPSIPSEEAGSAARAKPGSRGDLVERLVVEVLERAEARTEEIIEEVCRGHPQDSAAVRRQLGMLRAAGLLAAPRAGVESMAPGPTSRPAGGETSTAEAEPTTRYERIGPYQPLKELGRGGQAVVYLAEDTRLHRPVALKILKGFGPLSEILVRRFRREAEVASRLDHPGICAVYDAAVDKGIPYIAMRYVDGEPLTRKIARARKQQAENPGRREEQAQSAAGKAPSDTALTAGATTRSGVMHLVALVEKVARALHAAHEAGIVHRDVKPGNVLVTPQGEPVIVDFGLAGDELGDFSSLTQSGDHFGTPAYMSPEQLEGRRLRPDRRTDVYSLGVTLFECLTLSRPFDAPTREALYRAIQLEDPPDPRRLNPSIPGDLRVVLETALEKDRDRRYQTALDLAEDLRRVRAHEPTTARPIGWAGRALRWSRRRPALATLLLVMLLGVPVVAGLSGYVLAALPAVAAQRAQLERERVEARIEEGFLRLGHEDHAGAVAELREALRLDPENAEALSGLCAAFLADGEPDAVLDLLDRHAPLVDRVPDLERFRARALNTLGRAAEAVAVESRIPAPNGSLGCFIAGLAELERGAGGETQAHVRARSLFSQAIESAPRARLLYHFGLALAVARSADESRGCSLAQSLTTLWPESAAAWFAAAMALAKVDVDGEIAAMRKAIALQPDYGVAILGLGALLESQGRLDEALEEYEKAKRSPRYEADARRRIARVLWRMGRNAQAAEELRSALALGLEGPALGSAYGLLGNIMAAEGRLDESLDALTKAAEIASLDASAHANLGATLGEMGRYDEAEEAIRRALALRPELGALRYLLGQLLKAQGRYAEALSEWRAARDLRPQELTGPAPPVEQSIREVEELLALEQRLPQVLDESPPLEDAAVILRFARICHEKGLFADAVRLWSRAFELDPALMTLPESGDCYDAACAAARAAEADVGDQRSVAWRAQALGWLRTDLELWKGLLDAGGAPETQFLATLRRHRFDRDLAGVRDVAALARLPATESESWAAFWREFDGLLARVE